MSTTDADLPAMPHIPVVEKATVDVLGGKVIVELVAKDMVEALLHNYARAAIEADRARAAGEAEKLRADAAALDWIECRAMNGQIQIARSIMGKGYEIATLERNGGPVIITVELGTLRKAIAARTGSTPTTKEQGS